MNIEVTAKDEEGSMHPILGFVREQMCIDQAHKLSRGLGMSQSDCNKAMGKFYSCKETHISIYS